MKTYLLIILMLSCLYGKGQTIPEPEREFAWEADQNFWINIYRNQDYRNYYQGNNPEEMIAKAMEYAKENGVSPGNIQTILDDLSEDITDQLLEGFEEEVLESIIEETGIANYLDAIYERLLKTSLPRSVGIPVIDVGMKSAIKNKNTSQNEKAMLKMAVENWLNQQWEQQVQDIYQIQREDLEYQKRPGIIALLIMAGLDYEHFLSMEILLPERVLNYAARVQQIYQSTQESYIKGKELFTEFCPISTSLEIPQRMESLLILEESSKNARTSSWEMINQRRKALALAYLQMAERAREKGLDLREAIKTDGHFKMSDGDRLKAQQLVNYYMEDCFRYKEKADRLLKASIKNAGLAEKEAQMTRYQQILRLKNLAQ